MSKKILAALLCAALLFCTVAAGADGAGFPDVKADDWYAFALEKVQTEAPGIITGYEDGTFRPERQVTRGEFLKMAVAAAGGGTTDTSRNAIHWAGRYYTTALENGVLGDGPLFPCTAAALDMSITRYEMAVILSNVCAMMWLEPEADARLAAENIPDYGEIGAEYAAAVEQAYGKGLLLGYEDGSFRGDNVLRRCEAAVVIYRMLWPQERAVPGWVLEGMALTAAERAAVENASGRPAGFVSFAEWLRDGHMNGWYELNPEARERLFGDADKGYFATQAEAEPYVTDVEIPIWCIDRTGNKYSATTSFTVNKMVAEEVQLIFRQIYDDPERFPFLPGGVGGLRCGEQGRHGWGCAIDINYYYNAECNFRASGLTVTTGYGWYPDGTEAWLGRPVAAYQGTLDGPSAYSISPTGSVVKAFADYGWGWGGNGWSNGMSFDFMHFSVRPDGG